TSPSTAATRQPHSFPTRRSSDLIAQEEIRCITQWFHDHNQAVRFEDFRTAFVCLDHVGSLDTYRKVSLKKPGHNRHPLGVDSLGGFNRLAAGRQENIKVLLLARRQRGLPVFSSIH